MDEGQRLERFVRLRWGRRQGGIRRLATAVGTSADTVYRWFNGQTPPDTYYLGKLAEALGVSRWEIVAAMDGVEAEPDLSIRIVALEGTVAELLRRTRTVPGAEASPMRPAHERKAG